MRRTRHVVRQPRADGLDRRDVTRAVVLPQPEEAPQLALEVAGRLAEALEAGGPPVDGVDLDEAVDELLAHAPAVLLAVERRRDVLRDDVPVDALHDVERRADDRLVVAHREDLGHARLARERAQDARLAQDVVGAGRQRRARRAAQHERGAAAVARCSVTFECPSPTGRDLGLAGAEAVLVEELEQRIEDEQRRALVGRRLLVAAHDVVGGDRVAHGACAGTFGPWRAKVFHPGRAQPCRRYGVSFTEALAA